MSERFYKISEFSRLVGISQSTLREYERKGILMPHHKSAYGYRYYSDDEYERVMHGNLKGGDGNEGC